MINITVKAKNVYSFWQQVGSIINNSNDTVPNIALEGKNEHNGDWVGTARWTPPTKNKTDEQLKVTLQDLPCDIS